MRRGLIFVLCWCGAQASAAEPLRVYAAGSLGKVLPTLIAQSGLDHETVAAPVFGPAGVLGKRLLAGENADLFLSADLAQPRAVTAQRGGLVVPFARNRMCVAAPKASGLTADNLLDKWLDPSMRLATSTPGTDPGGDYALAVFAKAEALRPGAEKSLTEKALHLMGGPGTMTPKPGHSAIASIFLENRADALIYYCSGAADLIAEAPTLENIDLPPALDVRATYGLAVLSSRPEALRLALFLLSETGQALLQSAGFTPIAGDGG